MSTLGPVGTRYTFPQIRQIWIDNGGNPNLADTMAGIAIAESGGLSNNLNNSGRDYSVGLWQINYFGDLLKGRTASYGAPEALAADVNKQAKAAISLAGNGSGLSNWTTFTSGAYKAPVRAATGSLGALPAITALPVLSSAAASQGVGVADGEGPLFTWHIPTTSSDITLSRGTVRKVLGGAVLVTGGIVGLAGIFLLAGGKAPSVSGVAQSAIQTRTGQKAARAQESVAATGPDELAERRRRRASERRGRAAAEASTSARKEGRAAADAAGGF